MSGGGADGVAVATRLWAPEHVELFRKLHQNVVDNPGEAKYRRVKLSNARIASLVSAPGVRSAFEALGWQAADGGEALELPPAADLGALAAVLRGTAPPSPPGEAVQLTVLRGTLKVKLELPSTAYFGALAAVLEQHPSLGHVPRGRQRLLAGYPPRPLEECHPGYAAMSVGEMGLKAVKLEDAWEEVVGDLRAGRATFAQLEPALACAQTVRDHRPFLLESALSLLRSRSRAIADAELLAARRCFRVLWPAGCAESRADRAAACAGCTALAAPGGAAGAEQLRLSVDRSDVYASALAQVSRLPPEELARPLQVGFAGEAAEDAGGPRREFFNEFGRAAASAGGVWSPTPVGTLRPSLSPAGDPATAFRGCGRVFGLALCQAENAAQEQTLAAGATFADLLAAVRGPEEGEQPQHQRQQLLLGAALSRAFLRSVLGEPPASLRELQEELNAEQLEGAPDFRGSAALLRGSLEELGLAGALTFSYSPPGGGAAVELAPGGAERVVAEADKLAWLEANLRHELVGSMAAAAGAFRAGVCEAGGAAYLALLSAEELGEAWSGRSRVEDEDLRLWQRVAKVNPARRQQAAWFFEVLWEPGSADVRPRVLKFSTGSDRWPADPQGFTFCIEPLDGGDEKLPRAMTCGNMLQLPSYTSREALRGSLLKACEWGQSMDLA